MELPSGRIKDIMGHHYGEWEVLEFSHLDKYENSVWKCRCSCGTIKYQGRSWLMSPNIGSCGCQSKRKVSEKNKQNLTGQKFGRLTALRSLKEKKQGNYIWEWACDCGNIVEIKASDVKSGNTKSCGCLQDEVRIQNNIIYKRKPDNHSNKNTKFNHYRNHAKNRKVSFYLTKEQFIKLAESNCYYCGIKAKNPFKANKYSGEWLSNGIDRLDSNLGYMLDNCVPCCKQCNTMKMHWSRENFYKKVKEIYEYKQLADRITNINVKGQVKQ